MTEQQVYLASQMYQCRRVARNMLGAAYKSKMQEYARIIHDVATRDNCGVIVAGATVIKESNLSPQGKLLMLAAIAELIEPS